MGREERLAAAVHGMGGDALAAVPAREQVAMGGKARIGEFNTAAHGLRGVAALMVFAGHLLGGSAKHIYNDDPAYVQAVEGPWHLGTAGVVLFFVISGFVILPSVLRYSPGDFALRRFMRIYPLFFVLSLVFVVLNSVTHAYPKLNDPLAIFAGLTFTNLFFGTEQLTPNAWSLTFEAIFYALICLVVYFAVHRPHRVGLVLAIGLSLAFVAYFPIACFFVGGVAIRMAHDCGWRLPKVPARVLEVTALACFTWFASMSWFAYVPADFANPIALAILGSSLGYFALAVSPDSLTAAILKVKPALYLGTVSYSLYLVHPYTYYVTRELFEKAGLFTHDQVASMTLFYAVATPLTLAATHVVHKTLEMKPYQWMFHQRIYSGNGTSNQRTRRDEGSRPSLPAQVSPQARAASGKPPAHSAIVHLDASDVRPGRLGQAFHAGAIAVVIKGDPAVRALWNELMANPEELPWTSPLADLSINLRPHDDLTKSIGDIFYFKPARHSYIARKIEIEGLADDDLTTNPSEFWHHDRHHRVEPGLSARCWCLSRDILLSMGPPLQAHPDPALTFCGVLQQIKYQNSAAAHQALFEMMRNALGPWARIGYKLDQRREEVSRPFARRGLCDAMAILSLIPLVGPPLLRKLNAFLALHDRFAALPVGHQLLVKAHVDTRYFSGLCGTRDNIVTQVFAAGTWISLPISRDDVVIVPGLHAKAAYGIEPTLHRVLQTNDHVDASGDPRMSNVTLLIGAKQGRLQLAD